MVENSEKKEPLNKNNKVPKLRFKGYEDDWKIVNFYAYFECYSTNSLSWDDLNYIFGNVRNLHYGIIHSNHSSLIQTNLLPFINPDKLPKKFTLIQDGDLILADTSEDRKDVAKGVEIVNPTNLSIISGLHTIHLREKNSNTVIGFKAYYVASKSFRDFSKKYCEGIKVFSIKPSLLKYAYFAYPKSLDEQSMIVNFFNLIEAEKAILEQKINVLKKYKKGFSKMLLKKVKFRGVSLSKLCTITTGKMDANAMNPKGKYKFFTCSREDYLIDNYAFDCEALLISGNGEVGLTKYYYGKFNAYQRTYVLYNFKKNPKFIKLFIDLQINTIIRKETNKGAMPYIRLATFDKIMIPSIAFSIEHLIAISIEKVDKKIELLQEDAKVLNEIKLKLLNLLFI